MLLFDTNLIMCCIMKNNNVKVSDTVLYFVKNWCFLSLYLIFICSCFLFIVKPIDWLIYNFTLKYQQLRELYWLYSDALTSLSLCLKWLLRLIFKEKKIEQNSKERERQKNWKEKIRVGQMFWQIKKKLFKCHCQNKEK